MAETHTHTSHAGVVARLKRASGHLNSVVAMIEEGHPCVDIAQQLHAVERAIVNAKRVLIHDHLDHCLSAREGVAEADLDEIRKISRLL
jgi:DNA-binding FrmR family transcriptional regulator